MEQNEFHSNIQDGPHGSYLEILQIHNVGLNRILVGGIRCSCMPSPFSTKIKP